MGNFKKSLAFLSAAVLLGTGLTMPQADTVATVSAASPSMEEQYEVGTMGISGGGFVSAIITGEDQMYARTDVGGAYRYDFASERWIQLLDFITEQDRGMLSVDGFCIDPTNDDILYMLCGCSYFSDARTEIFRSKDAGETWDRIDVTDLIQVHGNGYGRHMGESIAVDPDDPQTIYCGGDVTAGESALIVSHDGGDTWEPVKGYDALGFYQTDLKWPTWTDHMVRALNDQEYLHQNGVSLVHIQDGKVYVGTTMAASGNLVVADVGSDDFEVVSPDLPTDIYPTRISTDADGNMLICYIAHHEFGNGAGGIFRYNPTTGTVEDISPVNNSIGACVSSPDNAKELIATTCAVWSTQNWDKETTAWGEWLYRSTDGGETWTSIYPGKMGDWVWNPENGEMSQEQLYGFPSDGGSDWIQGKAVHWSGTLVLNPLDPSEIWVSSGNGVFEWEKIWTEDPQLIFHADGIEEVVPLDMISAPGKNPFSVIGDYDGFEHINNTQSKQHQPNIGSTSAISYCPSNPDVMVRSAQNDAKTYYTLDGGASWIEMNGTASGGKNAITQLEDGTYRIFRSNDGNASYTDDFGATWNKCEGTRGQKELKLTVDPEKPNYVYGYTAIYNAYWFYDQTKSEPTFEDAHYEFMVSDDYGKTFTSQDVGAYDQCDVANRIAVLASGEMVVGGGWHGAYHVTDYGKTIEKLDSVYYCKTIGYGAPEKEGDKNTLYMWGMPEEGDVEGVYRSTDCGKTWAAINTQHQYGGTGNGNFLVGDMNTFGKVYMSTVGCGIVYMQLNDGTTPGPKPTTTKPTTTTTTTTSNSKETTTTTTVTTTGSKTTSATTTTTTGTNTTPLDVLHGDVNLDGGVSLIDLVYLNKFLAKSMTFNEQQMANASCLDDGEINAGDSSALQKYIIEEIDALPITA